MAEKPDRSMVRKALWDLICQTAERLQQESRQPLSKAEALVATAQKYPTLYMSYTAHFGHREHPDRSMVNAQIGAW